MRTTLCSMMALLATMPCWAGGSIQLDGPRGGWQHSGLQNELERGTAAYPKPPVDRGAQRYRTLIEGRLLQMGKNRKPHLLVVNGNPMPLYADEQGNFARPYAFGPGSNSIEIRTPDGKERKRVQFYDNYTTKTKARLRAILTWDDPHAEVDLHVIAPNGAHAFWANPQLGDGGGLDVDSVDGAGPEIFSSAAPQSGSWLFYINYWGNFNEAGYNFDDDRNEQVVITARLSLIFNENTLNERRESFVVPLRKVGDLTLGRAIRL